MTIVARTLSDQAFDLIRERIISNELAPMAPIRQEALAEELGISRIPVREALTRLEQQGLLHSHANRGYFVSPISAEEADEVFALRLKLEPDAAAQASVRADEPRRELVRMVQRELEEALHETPTHAMPLHRRFHMLLVQNDDCRLTSQFLEHLHVVGERYVHKHLEPKGRGARADREHRRILDAWLARDEARVRQLLTDHITGTLQDLRAQLAATAPQATPGRKSARRRG